MWEQCTSKMCSPQPSSSCLTVMLIKTLRKKEIIDFTDIDTGGLIPSRPRWLNLIHYSQAPAEGRTRASKTKWKQAKRNHLQHQNMHTSITGKHRHHKKQKQKHYGKGNHSHKAHRRFGTLISTDVQWRPKFPKELSM